MINGVADTSDNRATVRYNDPYGSGDPLLLINDQDELFEKDEEATAFFDVTAHD